MVLTILWDTFETVILPRRVTRRVRLTRHFYMLSWFPWTVTARRIKHPKRREEYLSLFGPLSLLGLLAIWAIGLITGYAMVQWAIHSRLNIPDSSVSFGTYLYLSGTTFFTLGYGDVTPVTPLGRAIEVVEAGNGFGVLAIVIGYFPVLYQSFSRREASISLLDARAGSPSSAAELLRRHQAAGALAELTSLLGEWEHWSGGLLESHLSYPLLCYFR